MGERRLLYCGQAALMTVPFFLFHRVYMINPDQWSYLGCESQKWSCYFEPLTNCSYDTHVSPLVDAYGEATSEIRKLVADLNTYHYHPLSSDPGLASTIDIALSKYSHPLCSFLMILLLSRVYVHVYIAEERDQWANKSQRVYSVKGWAPSGVFPSLYVVTKMDF